MFYTTLIIKISSEEKIRMMAIISVCSEMDFIVLYHTQLDSKAE